MDNIFPFVQAESCVGCGRCVRSCSMGVLGIGKPPEILLQRRCILCGHCVSTCPTQSISLPQAGIHCIEPPEDDLEYLICSRRSVRHFSPELPPRDIIERGLHLTAYAPSGKNQRAYRWSVLWGKEAVEDFTGRAMDFCRESGYAPELPKLYDRGLNLLTCNAPCIIIAWSPEGCLNPILDPAAAMATLDLYLNHRGLGTCWGGYLRQVTDSAPHLRALLDVPEGCRVRCALMTGWPQGEQYVNIPSRPRPEVHWLEALPNDE